MDQRVVRQQSACCALAAGEDRPAHPPIAKRRQCRATARPWQNDLGHHRGPGFPAPQCFCPPPPHPPPPPPRLPPPPLPRPPPPPPPPPLPPPPPPPLPPRSPPPPPPPSPPPPPPPP